MTKRIDRFKPQTQYTAIKRGKRGEEMGTRIPRMGKIRLGVKAETAKGVEYPKEVDYFVCPPEVVAVYGEEPKELDVYLPHEDPDYFFPHAYKRYQGSRLTCKGDGETASRINTETGEQYAVECTCSELDEKKCSARGSLFVILPDVILSQAYQIDTGSFANIKEILSSAMIIRALASRVSWIPLKLKRVPTPVQTPDGKVVKKALLKLVLEGNQAEIARYRVGDAISIAGAGEVLALPPAPSDEEDELPPDSDNIVDAEVLTDSKDESPEDAPGAAQGDPPQGTLTEGGDRQAYPPAQDTPPPKLSDPDKKLPPGKQKLLLAMLKGKGVDSEKEIADLFRRWYDCELAALPASAFEDAKVRISALKSDVEPEGPF
jgi:hypothetical protein